MVSRPVLGQEHRQKTFLAGLQKPRLQRVKLDCEGCPQSPLRCLAFSASLWVHACPAWSWVLSMHWKTSTSAELTVFCPHSEAEFKRTWL